MSEGDETVHQHQEIDEGLAGLPDDPDEEEVDGENGEGCKTQEGVEIFVHLGNIHPLGLNNFQFNQSTLTEYHDKILVHFIHCSPYFSQI